MSNPPVSNKVILMADIHASPKNVDDVAQEIENVMDYIVDKPGTRILIAGDVFDSPLIGDKTMSTADVMFQSRLYKFCYLFPTYMCYGNHDINPGDESPATHLLPKWTSSTKMEHESMRDESIWLLKNVALLDWNWQGRADDRFERAYGKKDNSKRILLGHCAVQGQLMRTGVASHKDNFMFTPEEIDSWGFGYVALGHYHKRQKYYIGALMQHNFGEEGNPTGFIVLDLDTFETEEIPGVSPVYKTIQEPVPRESGDPNYYRVVYDRPLLPSDKNFLDANDYSPYMNIKRVERTRRLDTDTTISTTLSPKEVFQVWNEVNNLNLGDNEIEWYANEVDLLEESYKAPPQEG